MTMQDLNSVNVTKLIDDGPVRSFQIFVIVLCSLAAFLDGIDTQSIGVAAPLIAANLKLSTPALGPVFSAALVGATLGALTFGPPGEHYVGGVSVGRLRRRISQCLYPIDDRLAGDLSGRRRAADRDHARVPDLASGIAQIPDRARRRNRADRGDSSPLAACFAGECAFRLR